MIHNTIEKQKAYKNICNVGICPKIPTEVQSVNIFDDVIVLKIVLRYLKKHPVCCAEPGCYIPFLRPHGLKKLAEIYKDECFLTSIPKITIELECIFEPGFKFTEEGFGEGKNWRTSYKFGEDK